MVTGKKVIIKPDVLPMWLYWFLIFPFIAPGGLIEMVGFYGKVNIVWEFLNILLVAALCLCVFILKKSFIKVRIYSTIILSIMYLCQIVPTIIYKGDVFSLASEFFRTVPLLLFVELFIQLDDFHFLYSLLTLLELLIYVNFLSILLFPTGMYVTMNQGWTSGEGYSWILGFKNGFVNYILVCLLLSFICSYKKPEYRKLKERRIVLICVSLLTCVLSTSSTCLIAVVIFLALTWFSGKEFFKNILNGKVYILIAVAITVFVVFLDSSFFINWLTKNILKKDSSSFQTRQGVWILVISSIVQRPFIGFGFEYEAKTYARISQVNAHNMYLWMMYRGGIVLLAVFVAYVILSVRSTLSDKNNKICQFISAAIMALMVCWITEVLTSIFPFIILTLALHYKSLNTEARGERKRLWQVKRKFCSHSVSE